MIQYSRPNPALQAHWLQLLTHQLQSGLLPAFHAELIRIFSGKAIDDLDEPLTPEEWESELADAEAFNLEWEQSAPEHRSKKYPDRLAEAEACAFIDEELFFDMDLATSSVCFVHDILKLMQQLSDFLSARPKSAFTSAQWMHYFAQLFLTVQSEEPVRIAFQMRMLPVLGEEFFQNRIFPPLLLQCRLKGVHVMSSIRQIENAWRYVDQKGFK